MRISGVIQDLEKILKDDGDLQCCAQDGADPSDPEVVQNCVVRPGTILRLNDEAEKPVVFFET
jgi:hypothetical protein